MPKVTKVRVSVGYTKNAGNYESARVEETIEADVGPEEKTSEVMEELRGYLKSKVMKDVIDHVKNMKAKR